MPPFHNPYHFVPVGESGIQKLDRSSLGRPTSERTVGKQATHDRFVAAMHSGSLLVLLTTRTKTVIGARRTPGNGGSAAIVEPFRVPSADGSGWELAIPETSLRGMIGSLVESLSGSAMRVLVDHRLSARTPRDQALSAVGLIVGKERKRRLLPLAWPHLRNGELSEGFKNVADNKNPLALKIYLYGNCPSIDYRKLYFIDAEVRFERGPFLAHSDYLKTAGRDLWLGRHFPNPNGNLILDFGQWKSKSEDERKGYHPGLIRRLAVPGDNRLSRYPWFLPVNPTFCDLDQGEINYKKIEERHTLDAEKAAEVFEELARATRDRDQSLPYRLKSADSSEPLVDQGTVVCFRPSDDGAGVAELSISSLWRRNAGRTYDWFRSVDPDLLPMASDREKVTLAEQLLGFVEESSDSSRMAEDGPVTDAPRPVRAFSGRVRFSIGRLASSGAQPGSAVRLPILSSPKPPSPAFYFRRRDGRQGVTRDDLTATSPASDVLPQGRKVYLANRRTERTSNQNDGCDAQRVEVKPIPVGTRFLFEVRYDNLSDFELGLLLVALRPKEDFTHRMGMGKPLNYGQVDLHVLGARTIDRSERYQKSPTTVGTTDDGVSFEPCDVGQIPDGLSVPSEFGEFVKKLQEALPSDQPRLVELRQKAVEEIERALPKTLHAIVTLGQRVESQVAYPYVDGQNLEAELFKWHQSNVRKEPDRRQFLRPIGNDGLPTLHTGEGGP